MERKEHWEKIYSEKELTEVSWYQPTPETSIQLIVENSSKDDAIIDIGAGDSFLVDNLLELGYTNISVLDISANAISRAKKRLGDKADLVTWIISDVTEFIPTTEYDLWHDRAAFHFLRDEVDVKCYKNAVNKGLSQNGNVIIGAFSDIVISSSLSRKRLSSSLQIFYKNNLIFQAILFEKSIFL